jgi:hypothetical protein
MRTDSKCGPLGRDGTGSVVGIHVEVAGMYTGTLIKDLIVTVQRAEQRAALRQIAEEQELHAIFAMQIPITEVGQVLTGAA